MTDNPELKPCPFCGSDKVGPASDFGWVNFGIYYVSCPGCGCKGPELLTNMEDERDKEF